MKNRFLFPALALLVSLASCGDRKTITGEELAAGFTETPDSIQTSVYWYWISNHISADGVRRDLESMKRIGIDRAFIGNIGLEDSESGEGPVKFYSEEWWEVMHAALKKASELGIEIGIFNSPGWSQSVRGLNRNSRCATWPAPRPTSRADDRWRSTCPVPQTNGVPIFRM